MVKSDSLIEASLLILAGWPDLVVKGSLVYDRRSTVPL